MQRVLRLIRKKRKMKAQNEPLPSLPDNNNPEAVPEHKSEVELVEVNLRGRGLK